MLLVEDATEVQVMQDLYRLQPTLTAMVQEGLLAAVTSPAMLYPNPSTQTIVLQRVQTKDLQQLSTALSSGLEAARRVVRARSRAAVRPARGKSVRARAGRALYSEDRLV